MTEKERKLLDRYIMHDTIHKLHHDQGKSMRWIADYLGINFRTVTKHLSMDRNEFQKHSESISNRECILDPYKNFIVDRLNLFQDTPAAQMHDWLKENHPFFPDVSPKTVYNVSIRCTPYCLYLFKNSCKITSKKVVKHSESVWSF